MLFNTGAKLKMKDAVIKVIYVFFILNLIVCLATATTTAATTAHTVDDEISKNITARSINEAASSDDAPLRINLAGEYAPMRMPYALGGHRESTHLQINFNS